MFEVNIYIETSYRGLKPKGGYYWAIVECQTSKGPVEVDRKGYVPDANGNRLEVIALEQALETLKKPCNITIYTDSTYLYRAFSQDWISKWKSNDWQTCSGEPVKNEDIWKKIAEKMTLHSATTRLSEDHSYKKAMKFEMEKKKT